MLFKLTPMSLNSTFHSRELKYLDLFLGLNPRRVRLSSDSFDTLPAPSCCLSTDSLESFQRRWIQQIIVRCSDLLISVSIKRLLILRMHTNMKQTTYHAKARCNPSVNELIKFMFINRKVKISQNDYNIALLYFVSIICKMQL